MLFLLFPLDFALQKGGKSGKPGSIDNYVTGASGRSQRTCNVKDYGISFLRLRCGSYSVPFL